MVKIVNQPEEKHIKKLVVGLPGYYIICSLSSFSSAFLRFRFAEAWIKSTADLFVKIVPWSFAINVW